MTSYGTWRRGAGKSWEGHYAAILAAQIGSSTFYATMQPLYHCHKILTLAEKLGVPVLISTVEFGLLVEPKSDPRSSGPGSGAAE